MALLNSEQQVLLLVGHLVQVNLNALSAGPFSALVLLVLTDLAFSLAVVEVGWRQLVIIVTLVDCI